VPVVVLLGLDEGDLAAFLEGALQVAHLGVRVVKFAQGRVLLLVGKLEERL
jgi:hypothetical protein